MANVKSKLAFLNKNKVKTIALTAIAIIIPTAAFYNDAGKDIYASIKTKLFPYRETLEKISKINLGQNIEYINTLLGRPTVVRRLPIKADSQYEYVYFCKKSSKPKASNLSKYIEYIYASELYYIQIITKKEGTVVFYAVTTRNKNFKPQLPACFAYSPDGNKLYLGEMHFNDFTILSLVAFYADFTRFQNMYEEQYYFIGVDKYCFLSQSSVGYEFTEDLTDKISEIKFANICSDSDDNSRFGFNGSLTSRYDRNVYAGGIMTKITPSNVKALRLIAIPNTYAVGEEIEDDDLMRYLFQQPGGVGIDTDLARKLEF